VCDDDSTDTILLATKQVRKVNKETKQNKKKRSGRSLVHLHNKDAIICRSMLLFVEVNGVADDIGLGGGDYAIGWWLDYFRTKVRELVQHHYEWQQGRYGNKLRPLLQITPNR
jgi:hypothetical protein